MTLTLSTTFPFRKKRFWIVATVILILALIHQSNWIADPYVLQALNVAPYVPIILGAVWFGLAGGIICAFLTSTCFLSHLLVHHGGGLLGAHFPQTLNIVMYNVVGIVTGYLAQRQLVLLDRYRRTADDLRESYARLREKTEALIESEEQLGRAQRLSALGELTASLAHEIGNPLGSIQGAAEILAEGLDPGDRKARFAELLLREVRRLDVVVRSFLGYARSGTELDGSPAAANLDRLLHEIAALLRPGCERRGVSIEIDVEPGLGESTGLSLDPHKLQQVFLNLTLNAVQATQGDVEDTALVLPPGTKRGGRDGHVWIRARRSGEHVVVTVEDDGPGIPVEVRHRIFDPFFTTKSRGTGLGLAIAKRIVTGLGGSIEVESEPGHGAKFLVILPAKEVAS